VTDRDQKQVRADRLFTCDAASIPVVFLVLATGFRCVAFFSSPRSMAFLRDCACSLAREFLSYATPRAYLGLAVPGSPTSSPLRPRIKPQVLHGGA